MTKPTPKTTRGRKSRDDAAFVAIPPKRRGRRPKGTGTTAADVAASPEQADAEPLDGLAIARPLDEQIADGLAPCIESFDCANGDHSDACPLGASSPRPGRPPGPSEPPPVVPVPASRCPGCGSTDRAPYYGVIEIEHGGIDPDGNAYTHSVRRRTRCLNCGQCRIDFSRENRVPADIRSPN